MLALVNGAGVTARRERGLDPEEHVDPGDIKNPLNKDFYQNLKSQAWWSLGRRDRLQRTKFAELSSEMKLLHEEQLSLRARKFWWKDWWCKPPQLKKGRQIDVFAVFEITNTKRNVALLIENKRGTGRFTDDAQAEDYHAVAEHMKNDKYFMNFVDYETLIIAPKSFLDLHPEKAKLFDSNIPYEEIAGQVLLFASAA